MLSTEAETAVGVLKMNSRILEPAELKRLDKQEKGQVTEVQTTGKGKNRKEQEGKLTCDQVFDQRHHLYTMEMFGADNHCCASPIRSKEG